jgi:predicted nucleic acid-binding Zn ribbon protein
MPDFCVFCGKPIPDDERVWPPRIVVRRYCSTSCAHRQQLAIKRLRDTSPPEVNDSSENASPACVTHS